MGITRDVSEQLDSFSQTPGAVLVRDSECWKALEPTKAGQVLVLNALGEPEWVEPGTGGGLHVPWTNIALINGWSNRELGNPPFSYSQLADGLILLRGTVEKSTANFPETVAVLPAELIPPYIYQFPVTTGAGTARLILRTDGDVEVRDSPNNVVSLTVSYALDSSS